MVQAKNSVNYFFVISMVFAMLSFQAISAQEEAPNKIEVNLEEEVSTKEKSPQDGSDAKEVELEESISMKEQDKDEGKPILAPLKQMKSGINSQDVVCKSGLQLVIKNSNGSAACVFASTASALAERGWAR